MKSHNNVRKILLLFAVVVFVIQQVIAQNGAWISHIPPAPVNDTWYSDAGGTCVGTVPASSQHIFFFDINISAWTKVDLGAVHNFPALEACGDVIISYSESILIGYSAITSSWDTITYYGTPLQPTQNGIYKSWGCSENLAYFVTDSEYFVFDGRLGKWQALDITMPPSYINTGFFWAEEDYCGVVLNQSLPLHDKILVYSLHTSTFNQVEEGGNYNHNDGGMTHGFVAIYSNGTDNTLYGYSASNNTFTNITINGHYIYGGYSRFTPQNNIENTATAFSYNVVISPTSWRTYLKGYDTRLGTWTETSYLLDPNDWSAISGWVNGGQMAVAYETSVGTNNIRFTIYNGQTGDFVYMTSGLVSLDGYVVGGTVLTAADLSNVLFYTIEGNASVVVPRRWQSPLWYPGDNFTLFGSYDPALSDSLDVYLYHGPTNATTHTTTWRTNQIYSTPYMCVWATGGPGNHTFYYSGILDDLSSYSFPSGTNPFIYLNEGLLHIWIPDFTLLYNAETGAQFFKNYTLGGTLGSSAILFERDSHSMEAYSAETSNWLEFTITENILTCNTVDYVGLAHTRDAAWTDVYYAYNGFFDNLVHLDPMGIAQLYSDVVGEQTILLVRDSIMYAFDPFAVAGATSAFIYREFALDLPITDLATTEHSIVITPPESIPLSFSLVGVEVLLDSILHTAVGDLEITITHNSITDTLVLQEGGTGDNFIGTQLSDAATESISMGEPPFTGRYLPYQPLSNFSGVDVNGEWTLRIYDGTAGNEGTLNAWGLKLYFDQATDVDDDLEGIPEKYSLGQNYPNPFNPSTTIQWQMPESDIVTLKIYDVLGSEVTTLVNQEFSAGKHEVTFNASQFSSGVYFYKLKSGDPESSSGQGFIQTKKMILIK